MYFLQWICSKFRSNTETFELQVSEGPIKELRVTKQKVKGCDDIFSIANNISSRTRFSTLRYQVHCWQRRMRKTIWVCPTARSSRYDGTSNCVLVMIIEKVLTWIRHDALQNFGSSRGCIDSSAVLGGRRFTVRTDQDDLQRIQNTVDATRKLAQWRFRLEELWFYVVHRAGIKHQFSDALSSLEISDSNERDL